MFKNSLWLHFLSTKYHKRYVHWIWEKKYFENQFPFIHKGLKASITAKQPLTHEERTQTKTIIRGLWIWHFAKKYFWEFLIIFCFSDFGWVRKVYRDEKVVKFQTFCRLKWLVNLNWFLVNKYYRFCQMRWKILFFLPFDSNWSLNKLDKCQRQISINLAWFCKKNILNIFLQVKKVVVFFPMTRSQMKWNKITSIERAKMPSNSLDRFYIVHYFLECWTGQLF